MKTTGLFIATLVLAALLGTLYWSNHHPATEDTAKTSLNTAPKILTLKQDDISGIVIKKEGSEVRLEKNSSGQWQITAPRQLGADQEAVSSMLSTISALDSVRLVDEKPAELDPYGLTKPRLRIWVTENGKPQELLIGDDTPSGSAVFAKLAADPRVFTLAAYNRAALDKSVNDLRDKRLLTADFDKVSQIELVHHSGGKRQDFTLERNKDAWLIVKPKPLRADAERVDDTIRALRDAKMDPSSLSGDRKAASAYKSAQPFVTATVTGASGVQELEVRKSKADYYAKSSVTSGIYQVQAAVGTALDKSLDDLANKKLFDFGYDPDKIEIHDGAKSYFLVRSGSDWWGPDGKKLDQTNASALVTRLRELSATQFADVGFTVPILQINVTSDAGKRVERVSVSQTGDAYFARRENEATIYRLPSAAILQLKEAAGNIRPQESPQR